MRHKPIKLLSYLLPVLLLGLMAFSGPPTKLPQILEGHLASWCQQYAPEKVYVQHDKPYYAPGQQIWLKAHVLDAATLTPSAKSRVLYVDLLNAENQPIHRLILKAENGKAQGDLVLPHDLPQGMYRLSAYTNWMRNFGEETFFNKEIRVVGADASKKAEANIPGKPDLQFFPEGGDLVYGILGKLAFKFTQPDGIGTALAGEVYDDQGRKVTEFKSNHLGMGAFPFQPQAGRQYVAKVKEGNGTVLEFPIPTAKANGFVLSVDELSDPQHIHVTVAGTEQTRQPLVLTGISRDALQFSHQLTVEPGKPYRQKIAKSAFPTGIARINLAKQNGEPLAERLVFVNHQDQLQVKISTHKERYGNRDKVNLHVEAKNSNGQPVATDLALAITDAELVLPDQQGLSINSYLLVTSDLRGQVEKPGYYFEKNDSERAQALSHLLMTQGWRGFSWQAAAAGSFPEIKHPSEKDLSIRGQLVTNQGKGVKGGEVLLYLKDQHEMFITTESDANGNFSFDGFDFTGQVAMVVQGTDSRGRRNHLVVNMQDKSWTPSVPAFFPSWTEGLVASAAPEFLEASHQQQAATADINQAFTLRGILLKDVEIKGKKDMVEPFKLHQEADVVLSGKSLPMAPSGNILESLQGRVAGLQVYRVGPNQFRASIRGQHVPPLYLLDGMPISESALTGLSQFDISKVEILKNAASAGIYGGRAGGGVIAFTTHRGGDELVEVEPGKFIIIHHAQGYSKVREFYSPRYDQKQDGPNQPDLRTTIYWNPSVQTDANGKATVSFFTADRATTYRAVAEGISADGKPGSGSLMFRVGSANNLPF